MILSLGVIYKEATGEITFSSENTPDALEIDLPAMAEAGEAWLIAERSETFNAATHYVSGGVIAAYPSKPHEAVVWDLASESWVEDLTELKAATWRNIKTRRQETEFSSLTYMGYEFEIDQVSQRRIQGAVQLASMDASLVMDWTLADNTVVAMTAEELIGLGAALGAHVSAVHAYARGLREQIAAATTVAELEGITWSYS